MILSWIGVGLLAFGVAFSALGVLGLYRMPDIFTRMHAAAKVITVGAAATLIGVAFLSEREGAIRAVAIMLFLYLTAPVATQAIARAAHRRGEEMAPNTIVDELTKEEKRADE